MIIANHLGVRAGRRMLLDDVTLRLPSGTLTAVLGRNGAGKTTLLRVLHGERPPDRGEVLFAGKRLHRLAPIALARRRAVLSQHQSLAFGLRVADVVELGRLPHRGTPAARDDTAALAAVARDFDLERLWEQSYPTLSGGERQRVHLARAAAQLWRPDGCHAGQALFLDEPAAALDLAQQRMALRFATGLVRRGAAVVAVLHDPNHAVEADQVVMLRNGRIGAIGAPADVLNAATLTDCLGIPVEAIRHDDGRQVFVT
jgi:iron complex transport system ATP-binding protein